MKYILRLACFSTALLFGACGDDTVQLRVHVVTSIVPGAEFAQVEVKRFDPAPLYAGATELARVDAPATFGQDFAHGVEVAAFDDLPPGEHLIQVRLVRGDRTPLISRRVRVVFTDDFVLRVHLTPDCVGVTCPAPAGSLLLSQCLAGVCVDERCSPPDEEFCPGLTFCNTETDCPAPVAACAARACEDGICQVQTTDGCEAGSYCDPTLGCISLPDNDAGLGDGGLDGGVVDGGLGDGGSPIIDGALCGAVCPLTDDPCHAGIISCVSGSAVCVPYVVQPVGSTCGENRVCGVGGACSECHAGATCSVGCTAGTVTCTAGYPLCDVGGSTTRIASGEPCSPLGACIGDGTCGTGEICDSAGLCRSCADGIACQDGCNVGHVSCADDGACIHESFLPPGSACGDLAVRDRTPEYTGYCDAASTCLDCVVGEACISANGCATGYRRCDVDETGAYGGCAVIAPTHAAQECAPGAGDDGDLCNGAGECTTPLITERLGTGSFVPGGSLDGMCAIRADEKVVCFDPTGTFVKEGLPSAVSVDGTRNVGCAVSTGGELWCWRLGNAPVLIPLPADAAEALLLQVGGYPNNMAVRLVTGQLMYADVSMGFDFALPLVLLPGVSNVVALSQRDASTISALRANGEVLRWNGDVPAPIADVDDATGLVANSDCVIHGAGAIACKNEGFGAFVYPYGVPSTPTYEDIPLPFTDIVSAAVAESYRAMCVLRATREVWCFGEWSSSGFGPSGDYSPPAALYLDDVDELAGACLRRGDGTVYCWVGFATSGLEGWAFRWPTMIAAPAACEIGDPCPTPPLLPECQQSVISSCEGGSVCATIPSELGSSCTGGVCSGASACYQPFVAHSLTTNGYTNCAIRPDGTPMCWGFNVQGVLGDPSYPLDTSRGIGPVVGLADAIDIALGYGYACAVLSDGSVHCWGNGDGTALPVSLPETATHVAVAAIAGQVTICAIASSQSVYCWTPGNAPTQLTGITDATDAVAGAYTICYLRSGGAVACMGDNSYGQFGDGTMTAVFDSVVDMQTIDDAISVAVTNATTCVVRASGELWCTGYIRLTESEGAVIVQVPERVALPFADAAAIGLGNLSGYVLRADGSVWWWVYDPARIARSLSLVGHYEEITGGDTSTCLSAGSDGVFCGSSDFFSPVSGP